MNPQQHALVTTFHRMQAAGLVFSAATLSTTNRRLAYAIQATHVPDTPTAKPVSKIGFAYPHAR